VSKKYRTKPIEIEAMEYTPETATEIIKWSDGKVSLTITPFGTTMNIKTLEGVMEASLGDFIIKGLAGEFYPCKPHTFHPKYEEILPEPPKGMIESEISNMGE
jgi:hypothetical protein